MAAPTNAANVKKILAIRRRRREEKRNATRPLPPTVRSVTIKLFKLKEHEQWRRVITLLKRMMRHHHVTDAVLFFDLRGGGIDQHAILVVRDVGHQDGVEPPEAQRRAVVQGQIASGERARGRFSSRYLKMRTPQ
jgi:hypothetical protein